MHSKNSNPMDRKGAILSAVALSALGAMFYNLLPLFLGVAQDYRELDNTGIGVLSSLFFAGPFSRAFKKYYGFPPRNARTSGQGTH